jgi:hypothetical protein
MMQSLRVSPDVIDRCQNHTRLSKGTRTRNTRGLPAWLRLFAEAMGPIKGTPNFLAAAADASHDASPMQLMIATAFLCVTSSRMLRESLAG